MISVLAFAFVVCTVRGRKQRSCGHQQHLVESFRQHLQLPDHDENADGAVAYKGAKQKAIESRSCSIEQRSRIAGKREASPFWQRRYGWGRECKCPNLIDETDEQPNYATERGQDARQHVAVEPQTDGEGAYRQ